MHLFSNCINFINIINIFIWVGATFRLTHLIVFDTITEPFRNLFFKVITVKDPDTGQSTSRIEIIGKNSIRRMLGKLLSCHWCTGFWVANGIVLSSLYFPPIQLLWLIFAVAGIAGWIENRLYG
ncbi:DUF1360 domain-containing protein [Pasteuria penetrans]|uniref:DUF1360 domain-containing protein n=1 Tax=Pasteuria penetrans TaxID=86005 RepID=UPI000FB4EF82|nr:DUF1360 domain-containing protein [Pasteuria penetrans]